MHISFVVAVCIHVFECVSVCTDKICQCQTYTTKDFLVLCKRCYYLRSLTQ